MNAYKAFSQPLYLMAGLAILVNAATGQELSMFALQGPGQASVVIDEGKKVAHIIDLGKNGDGDQLELEGKPLLQALRENHQIERLTFTCSHPHADHHGGIKAMFKRPENFGIGAVLLFGKEIPIIESSMPAANSLATLLNQTGQKVGVGAVRRTPGPSAYAGYSAPGDAVFIENVPYTAAPGAGVHGRSVVTKVTLGGQHVHLDFDDADSAVIRQVAEQLGKNGVTVDSFVVPHHGSAAHDIDPILALGRQVDGAVRMKAIISVDPQNRYGHPAPEILAQLMRDLGKENVVLTGAEPGKRVRIRPEGIVEAPYTAADPGIFALFVEPAMRRAPASRSAAMQKAYDEIWTMVSRNRGEPPPDKGVVLANARPPKKPKGGAGAISEQFIAHGTITSPAFDAGSANLGLITAAHVSQHQLIEPNAGKLVFAGAGTGQGMDAALLRQISHTQTTLDPNVPVTVRYLSEAGVPDLRQPAERRRPNGGMVNLTGDKMMMGPAGQVLVGGTIEKCQAGLCLKADPALSGVARTYTLPFGFSVAGAAVWDRTYRRGVSQLYLSIDPTRRFLNPESDANRKIPSDRLRYGATLPPEWLNNRVVTLGDIQNSIIGKVLWEADVAFKSRSLGFDVLTGMRPPVPSSLDLTNNEDRTAASIREHQNYSVARQDRWCRMYWESGEQTIDADKVTGRIRLQGKAVVAHGEAMVLDSGKLKSFPAGEWCDDAKAVARSLEANANSAVAPGLLRDLRNIAEAQNFWRWARDHSIKVGSNAVAEFERLLKLDGKERVPEWTSGIKSTEPVLIQYVRRVGDEDSQLLYIRYAEDADLEKCVLPKWDKRTPELAAVGIQRVNGKFEGSNPFSKVDAWMSGFAESVRACSGGKVLPPKRLQTNGQVADEPTSGSFGVEPRRQPIEVHGGIRLGKAPLSLRESVKANRRLDDPSGKPVFVQTGTTLHFWSQRHPGEKDERAEHVEIQSASLLEAYSTGESVNFLVHPGKDPVLREELRRKYSAALERGVEWFGVFREPGKPAYIQSAAWPCALGESDCAWVYDMSREELEKYLDAEQPTPESTVKGDEPNSHDDDDLDLDDLDLGLAGHKERLIEVERVDDDTWVVKVNVDEVAEALTMDEPDGADVDVSELAAKARTLSWWGMKLEGLVYELKFQEVMGEKLESLDYIAASLALDDKALELLAARLRIEAFEEKQSGDVKDSPSSVLAQITRYVATLSRLPFAGSGPAWSTLSALCEELDEATLSRQELAIKTRIQSQIVKMKASADALTGRSSRSILGLF
ncbi:MAG: hypothetical protein QM757_26175 [Paludibaculum sp.]